MPSDSSFDADTQRHCAARRDPACVGPARREDRKAGGQSHLHPDAERSAAAQCRALDSALKPMPATNMALVRKEAASDAAAIEEVTIAAFHAAPHTSHTEQFIIRALRNAGQLAVSLVAEEDGRVIGHVAVSPVAISDGSPGWYGLGPLSVAPERQGQGIGTLLVEHALSELEAMGAAGCVVLGEPGYYSRFGFAAEAALVLPGVPPEYFQAIALKGPLPRGEVQYHAAFDATA